MLRQAPWLNAGTIGFNGWSNIMADGRKRPGPPEDSSSSRTKQRFSLPNHPDTRPRNMKKAIAGVLVVLGMFLTPGAAVAGLHESTRPGCFPLQRSSGMFAHACCVTTRVTAGVGGWRSCLMSRLSKIRKKRQTTNNPALDNSTDVFHGNPRISRGNVENSHLR